jgi:hypothetical protein
MTFTVRKLLMVIIMLGTLISACKHEPLIPIGWVPPIVDPPDTTIITPPDNDCDPDTVYFTNTILPLLNSSCAIPGCHDQGSHEDGVVLDTYNNIINTGDVKPGDPNDSKIFEVVTDSDPDDRMPPPGSGVPALTPEQIMDLFVWIQQGALNNGCNGCDTSSVTFSASVFPIIQTNCVGCHSGSSPQGGFSITNYTQTAAAATSGKLMNALNGTGGITQMPLNQPPLSDCAKRTIEIWIADGTPNN